jgi:hypothetical protein
MLLSEFLKSKNAYEDFVENFSKKEAVRFNWCNSTSSYHMIHDCIAINDSKKSFNYWHTLAKEVLDNNIKLENDMLSLFNDSEPLISLDSNDFQKIFNFLKEKDDVKIINSKNGYFFYRELEENLRGKFKINNKVEYKTGYKYESFISNTDFIDFNERDFDGKVELLFDLGYRESELYYNIPNNSIDYCLEQINKNYYGIPTNEEFKEAMDEFSKVDKRVEQELG